MRNKTLFSPLLFIAFILTSCEFKCSVGDTTADKEGKGKPVEKNGTLLYNGIKLEAKEVRVKKAYLVVNDDSGEMVDEGNFVDIRKGVKLILRIGDGWTVTDDRVWLGASMKVYSETGELLLVDTENEFTLQPGKLFGEFYFGLLLQGRKNGLVPFALGKR